jgi:hypothetical protein
MTYTLPNMGTNSVDCNFGTPFIYRFIYFRRRKGKENLLCKSIHKCKFLFFSFVYSYVHTMSKGSFLPLISCPLPLSVNFKVVHLCFSQKKAFHLVGKQIFVVRQIGFKSCFPHLLALASYLTFLSLMFLSCM